MASTISGHVQEVNWSFVVREVFRPQCQDNKSIVVLAGDIISGSQDDPIGCPVRVLVGGTELGHGTIVSRFRFDRSSSEQSAYVYEGSPINREDINSKIVLMTCEAVAVPV